MPSLSFTGPPRSPKPRARGLTSIIDFGPDGFGWTGPRGVRDLLDVAAEHIDYAKIYAMNALLIPEEVVTRIVRLYRDAGVTPYAGGILFEHAAHTGQIDGYINHLHRIGIKTAEVSENYLQFPDATRERHIETLQRAGISVIYEFGLKNPSEPFDLERLEAIVRSNIDQGVQHVIVEQSEIDMARSQSPGLLGELASRPWFRYILIEADPYGFPTQHAQLLGEFGPDANLANIAAGQALRLEGMRRGVGRSVNYAMFKE
ncbi:MAG: phosphosulfolactate synthase [Rhodobacteraceae bacterium HLUCCA12]|nr:MAG: phosphosulfolactate synthase [Rhodobacteraceae bacterium HLUCCA12]